MIRLTKRVVYASVVVGLFLATSAFSQAQDVRDRELRPAVDFTKIQMPVEIVSIKLNGREVKPGEKVKGNDDWLLGASFELKNISDRPIVYVAVGLRFIRPERIAGFTLSHGVDFSRGDFRRDSSPPAIQPGETVNLVINQEKFATLQRILTLSDMPRSFDVAPYLIERVSFEDDRDVIWEGGYLMRRDPASFGNFKVIAPFVLTPKPK
jgi:hypothetical protein